LWYGAAVIEQHDQEPPHPKAALAAVLLFALLVRVAWGLSRPTDSAAIEQLPDQREYLELADNLLHGRGLHFFDPRFRSSIYAYRTPGYPILLAACGASIRAARVAQAMLDTSTVLAAYLLARRWLTRKQSLFAAAIVAVNPFLIYFSALLLSETLFTAMLAWSMVLLQGIPRPRANAISDPPGSSPLLGGLLLALSVLVRPSAIGLPVLLGIVAAVLNRSQPRAYPRWWPFPPATTMLLFTLAVLAPWAYRNHLAVGHWIWTTTNSGITAYDGFNEDATGASDQRFIARLPGLSRGTEVQRSDFLAQEASRWAREHPRRVMELALVKAGRTWSPVPLSAEFGRPLYRWIAGLYALPFDILVILGLWHGRIPRTAKVFLLIPAIYLTIVHALSVGSLRYRLPAEPPMAVIAIASGSSLVARARYRRMVSLANDASEAG
jgi:4-amino-4-deoxy-L-arabinose transferase-like glycosyltransferase